MANNTSLEYLIEQGLEKIIPLDDKYENSTVYSQVHQNEGITFVTEIDELPMLHKFE